MNKWKPRVQCLKTKMSFTWVECVIWQKWRDDKWGTGGTNQIFPQNLAEWVTDVSVIKTQQLNKKNSQQWEKGPKKKTSKLAGKVWLWFMLAPSLLVLMKLGRGTWCLVDEWLFKTITQTPDAKPHQDLCLHSRWILIPEPRYSVPQVSNPGN